MSAISIHAAVLVALYCAPRVVTAQQSESTSPPGLDEVIVTAEKREENVLDVPIPVSVLNADSLAEKNQWMLRDYAATVPGFNVSPLGFGSQALSIRGVTTSGFTLPTVGVTIDGIPYGGLLNVPDPDPGDLQRIEILRGPQGTLYGANSMGGLINFVTKDPSTQGYNGRVEAGTSSVHSGNDLGYNFRASANVPVTDSFAFRVSGYTRRDPGYIDNPVSSARDLNQADAHGARASALWKPTEDLSIKLSALYDHVEADGSSEVTIGSGLGDLQQNYIPGAGNYRRTVQAYSATVKVKLGAVSLESLTGYNDDYGPNTFDWSSAFGAGVNERWGVTGAVFNDFYQFSKVAQELRLSGKAGEKIDWLVGGFYAHTKLAGYQFLTAVEPATGQVFGQDWILMYPRKYDEYAGFVNVTYHFTDRFDVQFGGRESKNEERQAPFVQAGPLIGDTPLVADPVRSKSDTFTYLVTPRYKLTEDLMVYTRFASGYRPGGPNTAAPGLPPSYDPDKTQNYEVGLKGEFFDQRLTVDASAFYIDWKNIQIQRFSDANLSYTSNGSGAKSQGLELSAVVRPIDGLNINGWLSWNDAVLTEPFPDNSPLVGLSGDRLPLSSRFSGNISITEEFPIVNNVSGLIGGTVSYIGDRLSVFTSGSERQELPSYTTVDLKAGATYDSWAANLYVTNLTDERGVINGGLGYILPFAFIYTQPRTVGLSVTKTFR